MKTNIALSTIESVNYMICPGIDPDDTVVAGYCRMLEAAHIQLGMLAVNECESERSKKMVQSVMETIAILYEDLDNIRKEVVESYQD